MALALDYEQEEWQLGSTIGGNSVFGRRYVDHNTTDVFDGSFGPYKRKGIRTPETSFAIAMLEMAVHDLRIGLVFYKEPQAVKWFLDAYGWICREGYNKDDKYFPFDLCCEVLKLDPVPIREQLLGMFSPLELKRLQRSVE